MNKLLILVVCVFFTLTTLAQTWPKSKYHNPPKETGTRGWPKSKYNRLLLNDSRIIHSIIESGFEFDINDNEFNRCSIDLTIVYQTSPVFSTGVGIGVRKYDNIEVTIVPIFVDIRRYINTYSDVLLPYFAIKMGYGFDRNDGNGFEPTGILFSPSMGINIALGVNTALNAGVGFNVQKLTTSGYEQNSSAAFILIGIKL